MSNLKTFQRGGIHPDKYKLTTDSPIIFAGLPEFVTIPVKQHIGAPAKILVNVGDKVTKGSTICVIEAMKMENDIQSEVDGVVKEIFIEQGDAVSIGDTLMVIE